MENLSILVVSCDKYSDLWHPFFELKKKYWPDCKYQTYLGTNTKSVEASWAKTICIGEDISWADNIRKMLDYINTEYIILLLEDFFIDKKVNSALIDKLFDYAVENHIDCLRLEPKSPPVKIQNRELRLGYLKPGALFYVSTQPAIWKKNVLEELLVEGYSAWDFEIKNSKNSVNFDYRFAGVKRYAIHHKNGVERGKFYASTVRLLKREKIDVDVDSRGIINDETLKAKLSLFLYYTKMWIKRNLYELKK